jgi:hypothetical protein
MSLGKVSFWRLKAGIKNCSSMRNTYWDKGL